MNNGGCSPNAQCAHSNGVRICSCQPGYQGDGMSCLSECRINNGGCSPYAGCTITASGRTCRCVAGFQGNGVTCTRDCQIAHGGCSPDATCTNTPDARTCTCKPGFYGDGFTCKDIDECLTNNGGCSPNAWCQNIVGSRNCFCNPMYQGDGITCTREALVLEGPFDWNQNQGSGTPTDLGWPPHGKSRMCWLTRMTGRFRGEGEGLAVLMGDFSSNWYFMGRSNQVGVEGSAMCTNATSHFATQQAWKQGSAPTYLGPANSRFCFLTAIQGEFAGWGEYVHVYVSDGSWYLGGGSQKRGVRAEATCFTQLHYSDEYTWKQGWVSTQMRPYSGCALTFVSGRFLGGGEVVRITYDNGIPFLGGASQQADVQARARCFW